MSLPSLLAPPGTFAPQGPKMGTLGLKPLETSERAGEAEFSARSRVVIMTSGTRGDVQPFIALAAHLQASGFDALVLANINHVQFIESFGIQAKGVLPDIEKQLEHPCMKKFMATGKLHHVDKMVEEVHEELKLDFAKSIEDQHGAIQEFAPRLILATPLQMINGALFGRLFELPVINCGLQPGKPTRYFKSVLGEPCFSYIAWQILFAFSYKKDFGWMSPIVHEKFGAQLGDAPLWPNFRSFMDYVMNPIAPELLGISPALMERPADWPKTCDCVHLTGFWVVGQEEQRKRLERGDSKFGGQALRELEIFLAKGMPPVYMGWGSMCAGFPENMTLLAVRSLKLAGLRGIILGGWAKLNATMVKGAPDEKELEEYIASNVLFVDSAPHEWLFPQCSVTVHHGGAGTTAAALRSGNPTIITPCFLDQFGMGQLVVESGCGLKMPQFSKVTPERLGDAIKNCSTNSAMKERACQLGKILRQEDGLATATNIIDEFLTGDLASGEWLNRFKEQRNRSRVSATRGWCCPPRSHNFATRPETSSDKVNGEVEEGPLLSV
mmetsp:Transcript_42512/g.90548  ORF Transcript_42512/g.90548 Transcript_42512/m.90548 type:complete len:554 (+) Transcript_42512:52-1713(+)